MTMQMRARSATGQAVTETLLLTWLMLVFFAAALQIFVMNESLFRSLTATHAELLRKGFAHNGWKHRDDDRYKYNNDTNAETIWRYQDFPEIRVQVLGMFSAWAGAASFNPAGGSQTIDIQSDRFPLQPDIGCGTYPCKKLVMGVGAAGPTDEPKEYYSRPFDVAAYLRLVEQSIYAIGAFAGNI